MTTDSFDAYLQRTPDETFTDWLRERSEPAWSETVDHRFVRELGAGTVDDDAFRRSLVQDYAFVESLTGLVGRAIADADPDAFYLAEWIGLHAVEDFAAFVSWLRGKLDRRGQELPPRRRRRVARHFRRTMTLERAFFDAAYDAPRSPD